jgi:hypothetical protein
MSRSFELAYAYARVCGSLARSFLGDRAASLATSPRVGEAWRTVFGDAPPVLPEAALADQAEKGLRCRAERALRSIVGSAADEEPFLSSLLRDGECAYVKRLLAAVSEHQAEAPDAEGLSLSFGLSGYPDLEKTLADSRYRWILEADPDDLPALKNGLDKRYYLDLWKSIGSVPFAHRGSLSELVKLDAELQNLIWALRLKRYYGFGAGEIQGLLIELPRVDLSSAALDAVSRRLDSRSDWASWKWKRLVDDARSPESEAAGLDVRGLEAAARRYHYRFLYHRLHLEPDTFVPAYAYYRIKELETRAIHGIIEGIKLEAPAAEIGSYAFETTGGAA